MPVSNPTNRTAYVASEAESARTSTLEILAGWAEQTHDWEAYGGGEKWPLSKTVTFLFISCGTFWIAAFLLIRSFA